MDYTEEERRILLIDYLETDEPSVTQVECNQQFEAQGGMRWDESNLRNNFPTLSN